MSIFEQIDKDADPEIMLPNRYSESLRMWFVRCECGQSPGQHDGFLGNHFPSLYDGAQLADPFYPGTALCRYSGRSLTVAAAVQRDDKPTETERRVALAVLRRLEENAREAVP